MRIGARATRLEYCALMVLPYVLLTFGAVLGMVPAAALLAWLSLPLALRATRCVVARSGRALNVALAQTGQTALLYGMLAAGMVLAH